MYNIDYALNFDLVLIVNNGHLLLTEWVKTCFLSQKIISGVSSYHDLQLLFSFNKHTSNYNFAMHHYTVRNLTNLYDSSENCVMQCSLNFSSNMEMSVEVRYSLLA